MINHNPKTPSPSRKSDKSDQQRRERSLEEGLRQTFPASDAIAVLEPVADHADDAVN
jgi:hypothetical protein